MTPSQFLAKFKSAYLWGNLAAMAAVVVLLVMGAWYGIGVYTHHGESIPVPKVVHKDYRQAAETLDRLGLDIVVSDTGYVKTLPADYILEQWPEAGARVKSGHVVYVIINAANSPTITLPDIIDNSSLREAMARLTAIGFKLGTPQFIPGEKDWVYGILVNGKHVAYGDKIPVDAKLIIQVGNGMRDASDSVNYVDPVYTEPDNTTEGGDVDQFEEVTAPPAESSETSSETTGEPARHTQ